jgi:pimeloyl-ACP methyl ester carboxylesterase
MGKQSGSQQAGEIILMALAEVNGVKLCYEVSGQGEPLVQIHGSGFGRGNFAPLTPLLAQEFRVIDYDMRGFGDSDAPLHPYSMELWADDLVGLLDKLEIATAHVHGTSMGGMVAIMFAAKYPHRTRGLVLSCALAKYDKAARVNKRVWRAIVEAYGKGEEYLDLMSIQLFSRRYLDGDDAEQGRALVRKLISSQLDPAVSAEINVALDTADLTPLLPQITAPTLVIGGRYDIVTPIDMGPSGAGSRVLADRIPHAELAIIDTAHMFLIEKPDAAAALIVPFLARVSRAATASG